MNRRAFTLIEVMISIAILAILAGAGMRNWHDTSQWLTREMDLQRANGMLRAADDAVRDAPYEAIPPLGPGVIGWPSTTPDRIEIPATDGEARHLPADRTIPLDNAPVRQLIGVDVLDEAGAHSVKATLTQDRVRVEADAGQVVRVRYLGRLRILARGVGVDDHLQPGGTAGKLVVLEVYDGDRPVRALTSTVLRMKP